MPYFEEDAAIFDRLVDLLSTDEAHVVDGESVRVYRRSLRVGMTMARLGFVVDLICVFWKDQLDILIVRSDKRVPDSGRE